MNNTKHLAAFMLSAGLLFTGCVDNSYDLENIGGDLTVKIDKLVIPIKVNEVTLDQIIDVPDGEGEAFRIYNGEYAIVQEGGFESGQIDIPEFTLTKPDIAPSKVTLEIDPSYIIKDIPTLPEGFEWPEGFDPDSWFGAKRRTDGETAVAGYPITTDASNFRFQAPDVPAAIQAIDSIGGDIDLTLTITVMGLENIVNEFTFRNVVLKMLPGLEMTDTDGGTYDPKTGLLVFTEKVLGRNNVGLHLRASAVDFRYYTKDEFDFVPNNDGSHSLSLNGVFQVLSGAVDITPDGLVAGWNPITDPIPQQLNLVVDYNLESLDVSRFTGDVKYDVGNLDIPEIDLSDIPDIFTGEGTTVELYNPLIYLSVNNPLENTPYRFTFETGFDIIGHSRKDGTPHHHPLPEKIILENSHSNYCLAPFPQPHDDFPNAKLISYPSLQTVLNAGGTLPQSLKIGLVKPQLPLTHVSDFDLQTKLQPVHGNYRFVAPLNFLKNTFIMYSDEADLDLGDMEDVDIDECTLSFNVTTNIPLSVGITAYFVDSEGNRVSDNATEATISPNAMSETVTLDFLGQMRDIAGLKFTASVKGVENNATLSPDMYIKLENVRPRISGEYKMKL